MRLLSVRGKYKIKWGPATTALTSMAFMAALAFSVHTAGAVTATLVVDEDGQATTSNCNSTTATPYTTISAAVTAANPGDTVKVCPGAYAEDVLVDKTLKLKGAKAGVSVNSRTFGSPSESTVTGLVTIQAPDVKLEGFSLTNPGEGLGVVVKTDGNNALIKKNIIDGVGGPAFANHSVGIYLELGPDGVTIDANKINNVQSANPAGAPGTAQGILVGDSTSTDPSLKTLIDDNKITNITSTTRGAYGIQVNNGTSSAPTAVGYTEVEIWGNLIQDLSGHWVHAIGLEGETPNAVVSHNTVRDLTDVNPVPLNDVAGVFFEGNPFFFTSKVNHNSLAVGDNAYGIAVHPNLTAVYTSLNVDGECNWWGAADGPGPEGTGSGSLVTTNVDFSPWLKSGNLKRDCDNGHHHKKHGHRGNHDHFGWRGW